jgi:signal transduction histidine kinase
MTEKIHVDDKQLRELLHLVSHDLRNPLAAIVTNLEFAKRLLSRINVDPDLAESVEDSVTACDVLRRIVSNFDVLAKGRDLTTTPQEVEIGSAVEEVVKRCTDRATQGNLALELNGADLGKRAKLDRLLFSLAVENLISNSIQHGPRGSKITVDLRDGGDHVTMTVADAGPAVPPELREIALGAEGHTPTGRGDGTRYGRGLGLLSAHAAASACGCTLTLDGDATNVFTLSVPLVQTD